MILGFIAVLFLSFVSSAKCDAPYISDDDYYQTLPPIFHIDPYDKCREEKKLFCRTSIKLTPSNSAEPSKVWKLIEETKKSEEYYAHDELYHAVCINKSYSLNPRNDMIILKNDISEHYTNKYKDKGLKATVVDINCDHYEYPPRLFDFIILFVGAFYLLLTIIATLFDIFSGGSKNLSIFSLRHNLMLIKKIYHHMDVQEIKSIQGMRFFLMVMVITGHTCSSFTAGYVADTKYIEDYHRNVFQLALRISYLFWIQPYFLISAWLLSYHTFKNLEKENEINFGKFAILKICNRYLRFLPLVTFAVCLNTTVWGYRWTDTALSFFCHQEYQRCQNNWWVSILFLSNHYRTEDLCVLTLWYLSADFQLYVFSVICLVLILKFNLPKVLTLSVCTMVGIFVTSVIFYIYNFKVVYDLVPKNMINNGFFSPGLIIYHASTYSNLPSYMLGLIFGYIYYRVENHTVFDKKFKVLVWGLLCIGIPVAVTTIPMYQYSRLTSAILAALLKPLFALGIGILMFGMAKGVGGVLKIVCEWKPMLYLGTLGYSTYVMHIHVVLNRTVTTPAPLQISDHIPVVTLSKDIVFSLIFGFVVHLLIELPMLQLQNFLVPRYGTGDKKFASKNGKAR